MFLEGRNVLVRECYKSRSSEYQEPICCIARIVLLYEICLFLTNYLNLQKKKQNKTLIKQIGNSKDNLVLIFGLKPKFYVAILASSGHKQILRL